MAWFSLLSRRKMALLCACLLAGLVLCGTVQAVRWSRTQLDTGALLCADTLRLHIRADSDAVADQSAKLRVRDAILRVLDERCPAAEEAAARRWVVQQFPALQFAALRTLEELGMRVPVRIWLVNMYFDTTRYAAAALPAGRYDALRIDIGADARYGKNWWCVLYPGLCRDMCTGYALPQENDLVCGEYLLRFRLVEWWQRRTQSRADLPLVG